MLILLIYSKIDKNILTSITCKLLNTFTMPTGKSASRASGSALGGGGGSVSRQGGVCKKIQQVPLVHLPFGLSSSQCEFVLELAMNCVNYI